MLEDVALGGAGAAMRRDGVRQDRLGSRRQTRCSIDGNAIELGETTPRRRRRSSTHGGRRSPTGPSVFSVGDAIPAPTHRSRPTSAATGRRRRRQRRARLDDQRARIRRRRRQPGAAPPRPAPSRRPRASPSLRCTDRRSSSSRCRARSSGPTTGTHVPGELYADLDGTLWFAVPATARRHGRALGEARRHDDGRRVPLDHPVRAPTTRAKTAYPRQRAARTERQPGRQPRRQPHDARVS